MRRLLPCLWLVSCVYAPPPEAHGPQVQDEWMAAPAPTRTRPPSTDKSDLIRVASPALNALVTSPLRISGAARGTWFFEASFPVTLLDANGNALVRTHALAQGEWMTEHFVPFTLELTFEPPVTPSGVLLLEKDNPSDVPARDDSLRIPVRFSTGTAR